MDCIIVFDAGRSFAKTYLVQEQCLILCLSQHFAYNESCCCSCNVNQVIGCAFSHFVLHRVLIKSVNLRRWSARLHGTSCMGSMGGTPWQPRIFWPGHYIRRRRPRGIRSAADVSRIRRRRLPLRVPARLAGVCRAAERSRRRCLPSTIQRPSTHNRV